MPNYLEFFPKPLLVDLCENQVLPFIGSGFSLNAIVPPGRRLPLIDRIAACLRESMPDFMSNSPMDIISEYDVRFGRAQLAEEFYKMLLIGVAEPGPAHLAFARLPFDIVATTNIDQLLEEAYFRVDRFPQVIMFDEQLPVKDTADDPVALLKLHGDVNFPDRLIWTEEDYDTFVARFPLQATYLACLLITRTPLFIGYSVDDYDLRMIWNIIGERLGRLRRQAYVIEVSADATMIARYQRRGVQVINLPGDRADFGQILTDTFRQLRRFLANNCPPAGIPPCSTLGQPIDVGNGNDDDCSGSDDRDSHDGEHGRKRRHGRKDRNGRHDKPSHRKDDEDHPRDDAESDDAHDKPKHACKHHRMHRDRRNRNRRDRYVDEDDEGDDEGALSDRYPHRDHLHTIPDHSDFSGRHGSSRHDDDDDDEDCSGSSGDERRPNRWNDRRC